MKKFVYLNLKSNEKALYLFKVKRKQFAQSYITAYSAFF